VSLVQRNVAAAQLVALGASVESDMRAGIAAADALDLRLRGLGVPGLSTNVSADAVPTAVSPAGPRPASPGTTTTQGGTTTTRTGRPRP